MTLAQIITDFKQLVGPAGRGVEVGDPALKVWVNDAYFYIVGEIVSTIPDFFAKKSTASSQASVGEYVLPDDFDRALMTSISYDGSTFVRALPLNNITQATDLTDSTTNFTTAQPYYYIFKNTIGFLPVFSSSQSQNIIMWYAYQPEELSEDSDEPDLPRKLVRLIKYSMYANYLDQNDEHVAAERMRLRFEGGVSSVVASISQQDYTPKTVEVTDNTFYVDDFI